MTCHQGAVCRGSWVSPPGFVWNNHERRRSPAFLVFASGEPMRRAAVSAPAPELTERNLLQSPRWAKPPQFQMSGSV